MQNPTIWYNTRNDIATVEICRCGSRVRLCERGREASVRNAADADGGDSLLGRGTSHCHLHALGEGGFGDARGRGVPCLCPADAGRCRAKWLQKHPNVAWVKYPSLTQPELAAKYLPNGAGGVVVFGVKGGSEEARKVTDAANGDIFSILANVGDAKSLIIHPASTTHSQLSDEDLRKGGVLPELIRLSIGLEHIDDIIDALDEAFKRAFPNG